MEARDIEFGLLDCFAGGKEPTFLVPHEREPPVCLPQGAVPCLTMEFRNTLIELPARLDQVKNAPQQV